MDDATLCLREFELMLEAAKNNAEKETIQNACVVMCSDRKPLLIFDHLRDKESVDISMPLRDDIYTAMKHAEKLYSNNDISDNDLPTNSLCDQNVFSNSSSLMPGNDYSHIADSTNNAPTPVQDSSTSPLLRRIQVNEVMKNCPPHLAHHIVHDCSSSRRFSWHTNNCFWSESSGVLGA